MNRNFAVFGCLLLSALVGLRLADPFPIAAARAAYFDGLQRLAPRAYTQLPVRVVDIDEASLAMHGQWPWPRDKMAVLVDRLAEYGAAAIVFDILFPEPDRMSVARLVPQLASRGLLAPGVGESDFAHFDNDARFADAMRSRKVVLGIAQIDTPGRGVPEPKAGSVEIGAGPGTGLNQLSNATPVLPVLAEAAAGLGSISLSPYNEVETIRTVPVLWSTPEGLMPALAMEGLRLALGADTYVLEGSPDIEGLSEHLTIGDFTIPTTPDGQIWVRYRRDDPGLYVSAQAVLDPADYPDIRAAIEGNIVLIGTSAAGLLDIRTTALGESVPGVSIHPQIIEQILSGEFLRRGTFEEGYEIVLFLALGFLVLAAMAYWGPVASIVAGFVAGNFVIAASWIAFWRNGALFDATFPMLGGFVAFSGLAAYQFVVSDRDKRRIRESFSHYVAPAVLSEIERSGHRLELGGITRPVTVMFCDIRDFTPLSARMAPADLVALLNRLFTAYGEEILAEKGTIDKFIGDAVMAFWNAPLEQPDHAARAAAAALGIRGAAARVNGEGGNPVAIALGLATGTALVGNIGSRERFNYSVIGEAVNLASRIELACRHVEYDILVSGDVARGATGFALLPAGELDLKGVSGTVTAYILVGGPGVAASAPFAELGAAHAALLAALATGTADAEPLLARCRELAGPIHPTLQAFYDRIPRRLADFRRSG